MATVGIETHTFRLTGLHQKLAVFDGDLHQTPARWETLATDQLQAGRIIRV